VVRSQQEGGVHEAAGGEGGKALPVNVHRLLGKKVRKPKGSAAELQEDPEASVSGMREKLFGELEEGTSEK